MRSLVLALFLTRIVSADHAPEWLLSKAAPETALMGIKVEGVTIGTLEKRFGKPAVEKDPQFPYNTIYRWTVNGVKVEVTTMHPPKARQQSQKVHAVTVWPAKPSGKAATSKGLRTGDDLADLVRIYGCIYQTEHRRELSRESSTVTVTFANETRLSAGFSDAGKIVSLELVASIE